MSRKQGLLIVFIVAVVLAVIWQVQVGGDFDANTSLPAIIGKTIGLFIFPGVIPCIAWACMRFRATRTVPIMAGWIGLQLLFVLASWFENSHVSIG